MKLVFSCALRAVLALSLRQRNFHAADSNIMKGSMQIVHRLEGEIMAARRRGPPLHGFPHGIALIFRTNQRACRGFNGLFGQLPCFIHAGPAG